MSKNIQTYEDYKLASSTEKIILATIDPSIRLIGFVIHTGFTYKITNFNYSVINSIKQSGVSLVEVFSLGAVSAGRFFNDKDNSTLYLRTATSVNPNSKFIVLNYRMFFSNVPIELPYDLDSGFDVEWIPYINSTSDFGVQLDNSNQQGFAIEGSGSINLINIQDYWKPIFDKVTFENKKCHIYSYNRSLPPNLAKLIFRGFINKKTYNLSQVSFGLKDIINELKKELSVENIGDYVGAIVPNNLLLAKQRLIYGYVNGHVPTPIDQILQGYLGTGTISVSFGSATVTGVGTSFLSEVSPDDQIFLNATGEKFSVKSIISDTSLELTDEYDFGTLINQNYFINPSLPKRYKNRNFLVAGHSTKEPLTTITEVVSLNYFQVADDSDLRVGDRIIVNGDSKIIRRVNSNYIKLTTNSTSTPVIGSTVYRPSVSDVYIDNLRLLDTSYTYDADTGLLELDELAEFDIAPNRTLVGTQITLTNGSRTVIGVDTSFTSQLKPSDWIRTENQVDFFEVLQIISDTELELRAPASYSSTNIGVFRSPNYYKEGTSVLSVNCIGKTKNGTKSGVFINTASEIVEDLLIQAGLSSDIDTASFIEANKIAPQRIGFSFPAKVTETKSKKIRDIIGDVSKSVFGSLVQTDEFKLAYRILSPKRNLEELKLDEVDIISFSISSDSSKIIKTAIVNYGFKEFDFEALAPSNVKVDHTPLVNEFLTESTLVNTYDSILLDENDAQTMAERYAFILQLSRALIDINTKLKTTDLTATDKVWITSEKLYERIGSVLNQKLSAVESIKKDGFKVNIDIDDLSNAFSRCGTVTENDAESYLQAENNELMINGYITDGYGMIENDANTHGVNLIW